MAPKTSLAFNTLKVTVDDDGRTVPGLREALQAHWLCTITGPSESPQLAVQVIRHLEPLGRAHRWILLGVPHLLIRFTDEAALVGPVFSESGVPCHSCEALHLVAAQPHLPMLAAARYGKVPRSESTSVALLVSSIAAHMIRHWLAGSQNVHRAQIVVPVRNGLASGLPSLATINTHPECGCAF